MLFFQKGEKRLFCPGLGFNFNMVSFKPQGRNEGPTVEIKIWSFYFLIEKGMMIFVGALISPLANKGLRDF
ncbi:MAG: hypothetical protein CM15mV112_040 [uncultured marine virus]|nr:MAG: hypothetical protein CM15mV112_040 [uncultured marine virus]